MTTDIEWINNLMEDVVNSMFKLSETILKVKLFANRLNNEKLKSWVTNEINGYVGKDVPEYRIVHVGVFGNLLQDRGYGGFLTRNDMALSIEHLPGNIKEFLKTIPLRISISELEDMTLSNEDFRSDVPREFYQIMSQGLSNGWMVDSAWQLIPKSKIQGILTKIKSNLIDFLTEISVEIGENENINVLKNKPKVDNIFDKTIGQISGKNIVISVGSETNQQVNLGKHSSSNVATGRNFNQNISQELTRDVKALIKQLSDKLDQIPLNQEDKEDIIIESNRVNAQLIRANPKVDIIQNSLRVIEGILLGVAANALTPPILNAIAILLSKIG